MARKAGVSETTISAIKSGAKPEFENQGEAITYAIAQEIDQAHELSDSNIKVPASALASETFPNYWA